MVNYKKPVCRGSFSFNSACGRCERCDEERTKRRQAELKEKLKDKKELPIIPMGTVVFDCRYSGQVEIKVSMQGKNVLLDTELKINSDGYTVTDKGLMLESSPVLSLFVTLMEAQRAKSQKVKP